MEALILADMVPRAKAERWLTFDLGDGRGCELLIRYLTPAEHAAARRKCRKIDMLRSGDDTDDEKWHEFLCAEVVRDWRGIVDRAGNPVPATAENRAMLARSYSFMAFVNLMCVSEGQFRGEANGAAGSVSFATGGQYAAAAAPAGDQAPPESPPASS